MTVDVLSTGQRLKSIQLPRAIVGVICRGYTAPFVETVYLRDTM